MTTQELVKIPGYLAGTWNADLIHSDVSFTVRHMMVSKVRGHFNNFEARITTSENPLDSQVTASIDLSSIDTKNTDRDKHISSADFLDVEKFPTMTFASTGVRPDGGNYLLDGDLSLHGVTRPVTLELESNGFSPDPYGGTRSGFTATGDISRSDFGIEFNMPMDGGGVVIGDKIHIVIEIEAVLEADPA